MPPAIRRRVGIEGAAAAASGPTIVIDTFRAFTTAAHLLDAGVARLVLTDTLDEARRVARSLGDALLCGEEQGRRPDDFDLGNSPVEVLARDDLAGRTVVMCTSAGTRCVVAAVAAGAHPVFAASLVTATATATALGEYPEVAVVASSGLEHSEEDEATAAFLETVMSGGAADAPGLVDTLRLGRGARRLLDAPFIADGDLDRCLAVDAYPFAMVVVGWNGLPTLTSHLVREREPNPSGREKPMPIEAHGLVEEQARGT